MFQLQLQLELSLGSPSALPAAKQADIQTASQAFHTFALIFNFIFSQANHGKENYTDYGRSWQKTSLIVKVSLENPTLH